MFRWGPRFITTTECDADIRYKEFHLQASAEDVDGDFESGGAAGTGAAEPVYRKALA